MGALGIGVGVAAHALAVVVGLGAGARRVVVGLGHQIVVLVLAGLGDFLGLGLALVDVLVVQLHGQRKHRGGALGLVARAVGGAGDLLQAAGLGARLDLGDLGAQLVLALLGLLELAGQVLHLRGLLLHLDDLLLRGGQLLGQVLVVGAEGVPFALHGEQLLAERLVVGVLRGLRGQLIDLGVELVDLPLQLVVLRHEGAVALLGLAELRLRDLRRLVALAGGVVGGGLQRGVLILQLLDLSGQIGDLRVQAGHIRTERLGGRAGGDCLLAERLDGLGHLIQKIVNLIDVISLFEADGLEGMLPDVLRSQQSHKSLHLALGPCLAVLVSTHDAITYPASMLVRWRFIDYFIDHQIRICSTRSAKYSTRKLTSSEMGPNGIGRM